MAEGEFTMKQWALAYAKKGLAVFPVCAWGDSQTDFKKPLTPKGCNDATVDTRQIKTWWDKYPTANIGIAMGLISGGAFAIDLDVKEDQGIDGRESLREWEREQGKLPDNTWLSITGSGGYHMLYWTLQEPVGCRTHILDGVDIRGEGGYIVAPPSLHFSGRHYEWEQSPEDFTFMEASDIVLEFVNQTPKREAGGTGFSVPAEIIEGERTTTLFKLVCSLQAKGLTNDAIKAAVQVENERRCFPPLTDKELEKEIFPALKRYEKGTADYSRRDNWNTQPKVRRGPVNLVSMDKVQEKEPEWLITDYMPRSQITALAGDGGSGKTTVWCSLAADVSSGVTCFLNHDNPFLGGRVPGKVIFFSSEDSAEYTLKRRLREHGARLENILSVNLSDERFSEIKFNSQLLEDIVAQERPELAIFDPIQSFIPPDIQMGQRNAMRACLNPLIGLGEKYGTTFLIIVHTNKQSGIWGRKRIADSADIWDIARSVLITGETGDGLRYISHEKSNYGPQAKTVLFRLDTGKIEFEGYTDKKDKDFVTASAAATYQAPQREDAKTFILDYLRDGEKETADLDEMMKSQGVSGKTLDRAKAELKKDGEIIYRRRGFGKDIKVYCSIKGSPIPSNIVAPNG